MPPGASNQHMKRTKKKKKKKGKLPSVDTQILRKDDGIVNLLVYLKSANTDQYLNFDSHYPLQHSVIRTLLETCFSVVLEERDRDEDVVHYICT